MLFHWQIESTRIRLVIQSVMWYIFPDSRGNRVETIRRSWRIAALWLAGAAALAFLGCGSGTEAVRHPSTVVGDTVLSSLQRDAALRHYIDGATYELKGEFAQAALEYQEALRYDRNHAIYYALAKCYSALNKPALAIEAAREAIRLAPQKPEYHRLLGDISAAAFDLDAAATEYEQVIALDSSSIDAWYNLARVLQARKPLQALEVYDQITARFGPQWDVLLQVAELSNKLGKYDRAAAALKDMTDMDPGNKELKRTLAQTYLRGGMNDEALSVFNELHELDPDDMEIRADIAGIWLVKKEYDRAAKSFEKILDQDSVSLDVKIRIGELYFNQMGKDSTLIPITQSIFERIKDAYPKDWRPYWYLGGVANAEKDDSLAVRSFRKVTELAGWNADGWVFLAFVYLTKNDFTHSAKILENALKVVPDDFRVNFFLGVSYSRLGRNQDAALVLEHARSINPHDVDAIAQLALVYDTMKKKEESDSLYEEALRLDPKNHLVLNNYGYSLAERGIQLQRALTMAQEALKAEPDNASYLDTMGWIYYQLGKFSQAETYVEKALSKGEVSSVVHEHLGDIYFRLDKPERALEQWNEALRLDHDNPSLREKIQRKSL
jgi:tetratricopeptide (TPR) repeat protein